MIKINLVKVITGQDLINDMIEKYGSIEQLEKLLEKDKNNGEMFSDLEDWKFFGENPEDEITDITTILTDKLTLTNIELELLNFIKNNNPSSIRELSRLINEDVSNTQRRISRLEQEGLLNLKEGIKNSKIPVVTYDKIEIAI
ncbi:HVO_A0114 family putative DNA-binding protein [Methanobrevibacter filiformis]|uniref:Uncharacterized protein n=1 Tax=Methanobrevibacter filiformis TaxID=55758 RepID=A0A166ERD4_9EURY|nr:winged helix-turn-helix transcriptional regulator [Methanobrevibacter filiformis]KZX16928.1 hypothetical protein MBFIL_04590 [Methanobrevibacter filiformis]